MNMQEYLKNRQQFPLEELARHQGEFIAWSPDGMRNVASAVDLEDLDDLIRAAGHDPENCLIEGIPNADTVIGGE